MKQASELTEHELLVAIARNDDWMDIKYVSYVGTGEYEEILMGKKCKGIAIGTTVPLPNYTTDLNAAAELLKRMPDYALWWSEKLSLWTVSYVPIPMQHFTHPNPARAISEAYYTLHIMQPKETE